MPYECTSPGVESAGIGDKQTRDLWQELNMLRAQNGQLTQLQQQAGKMADIMFAKLDEEARENARLREEKLRDDALYAQLDAVNAELHADNARLRERIADLKRMIADNPRV